MKGGSNRAKTLIEITINLICTQSLSRLQVWLVYPWIGDAILSHIVYIGGNGSTLPNDYNLSNNLKEHSGADINNMFRQ